jgi:hypothetical protein
LTLGAAIYDPFPNFKYTGPLRPVYPLSPKRHVPENIRRPDYAKDGNAHIFTAYDTSLKG